jgi:small subunit ribosomal protein S4
VLYRAGLGATRAQARQFVSHGHVNVNGKRVNVPSYRVRKGDVVEIRSATRNNPIIQWNKDVLDRTPPAWLDRAADGFSVTVYSEPLREQIDVPLREQLIVELYSK